jgi:hypothetical protein
MTEVYYCACDQARHDSLQLRVLGFGLLQDGDVAGRDSEVGGRKVRGTLTTGSMSFRVKSLL